MRRIDRASANHRWFQIGADRAARMPIALRDARTHGACRRSRFLRRASSVLAYRSRLRHATHFARPEPLVDTGKAAHRRCRTGPDRSVVGHAIRWTLMRLIQGCPDRLVRCASCMSMSADRGAGRHIRSDQPSGARMIPGGAVVARGGADGAWLDSATHAVSGKSSTAFRARIDSSVRSSMAFLHCR